MQVMKMVKSGLKFLRSLNSKKLIQYLTIHNFKIIELYDGIEITGDNMLQTIGPLLAWTIANEKAI